MNNTKTNVYISIEQTGWATRLVVQVITTLATAHPTKSNSYNTYIRDILLNNIYYVHVFRHVGHVHKMITI
jgi:hypothetical protein